MKRALLIFGCLVLGITGTAFGQFSNQNVMLEEFTGTWCPFCADGSYRIQQLLASNQNVSVVAIHYGGGDPMEIPDGGVLDGFYSPAYPNGLINRDGTTYSRGQWMSVCNQASQGASNVSVSFDSLDYNPTTREVTVRVRAQFTGLESGDVRFNLAVTEDNVTGGSNYAQANSDNGTPGHPYQGAGNPIQGFSHQHVLRQYVGGPWGTSGTMPNLIGFGDIYTHTYTFNLDPAWDENEIHLVAFVQKFGTEASDRQVLNSEEMALPTVVGIDGPLADTPLLEVGPNPIRDIARIAYTIHEDANIRMEVLDVNGKVVSNLMEGYQNQGGHTQYWYGNNNAGQPVANGIYLIRLVTDQGQSMTKRVMVAR